MSKKLIVVADAYNAVLVEANGRKAKKVLSRYNIEDFDLLRSHKEHKENFTHNTSGASNYFEPHKENKVIEREKFIAKISKIVEEKMAEFDFQELLIAAEPKTLGEFNERLSARTKSKVTRTLNKDLVKHDLAHIESEIFN
jgi:protein required for attachment to host cells